MQTERETLYEAYSSIVSTFVQKVEGINIAGIPEPHLPCIGTDYSCSSYRLAFYGKETKGWGCLKEFLKDAKVKQGSALDIGHNNLYTILKRIIWRMFFGQAFTN